MLRPQFAPNTVAEFAPNAVAQFAQCWTMLGNLSTSVAFIKFEGTLKLFNQAEPPTFFWLQGPSAPKPQPLELNLEPKGLSQRLRIGHIYMYQSLLFYVHHVSMLPVSRYALTCLLPHSQHTASVHKAKSLLVDPPAYVDKDNASQ